MQAHEPEEEGAGTRQSAAPPRVVGYVATPYAVRRAARSSRDENGLISTKASIIPMLTSTAFAPRSTADSIATPCYVNARGGYLHHALLADSPDKVTICDLTSSASSGVSLKL